MTARRGLHRLHRDERGQLGGLEAIPFGFLVLVVGALLAASAWAVVDTKLAVVSAAREAARTFVEAESAAAAVEAGTAAAEEAMANHGRRGPVEVAFHQPDGFERCALVTAEVRYQVPAVPLPWVGGLGTTTVSARHSERVDPFRDGIPGEAECPP